MELEHDQSSYFCGGPDDFCWGPAPVGPTLVTGPRDGVTDLPGRRSTRTSRLQVRLSTVGGRAFSVSGPTIWIIIFQTV